MAHNLHITAHDKPHTNSSGKDHQISLQTFGKHITDKQCSKV